MDVRFNWEPLFEFLKTGKIFDLEFLKADPEAYGKEIAEVLENCIEGGSLFEIFDGLITEAIIVGVCVAIAKKLKEE